MMSCIGIIDFVIKVLTPYNDYYILLSLLTWAAANCEIPHCAASEYVKANCCPTATKTQVQVPSKSFALRCNELYHV